MSKQFLIFIVLLLSACAPHFYKAKSLIIHADNIEVVSYGELSSNCIGRSSIPRSYKLVRELYTLELFVSALQVGIRVVEPEGGRYTLDSPELKANSPSVTNIDISYGHYFSTTIDKDITLNIREQGNKIASELFSLNVNACNAVVVDTI
ncbi:hypothetical protein [Aliikangiella coralliicola]|uniref:Lipoprotein n=1 Tax=Aliikangiella coralliicola TaxID=2592383 RepID=A0A545UFT8_9GAMM|nr:hypothetical protein [Aliikangiella coralliicola]TQV88253.1 hypothetical protein FLL46_06925 [Aliikangiella coralliicola]